MIINNALKIKGNTAGHNQRAEINGHCCGPLSKIR